MEETKHGSTDAIEEGFVEVVVDGEKHVFKLPPPPPVSGNSQGVQPPPLPKRQPPPLPTRKRPPGHSVDRQQAAANQNKKRRAQKERREAKLKAKEEARLKKSEEKKKEGFKFWKWMKRAMVFSAFGFAAGSGLACYNHFHPWDKESALDVNSPEEEPDPESPEGEGGGEQQRSTKADVNQA